MIASSNNMFDVLDDEAGGVNQQKQSRPPDTGNNEHKSVGAQKQAQQQADKEWSKCCCKGVGKHNIVTENGFDTNNINNYLTTQACYQQDEHRKNPNLSNSDCKDGVDSTLSVYEKSINIKDHAPSTTEVLFHFENGYNEHHSMNLCNAAGNRNDISVHLDTDKSKVYVPVDGARPLLGLFDRALPLWVALCMIIGTIIGNFAPEVGVALERASVSQIDIPVAVLVWLMIFPMAVRIEWASLLDVKRYWKGLSLCFSINWGVQPFLMFGLALLFIREFYRNLMSADLQSQYMVGAVLLGGSPCTAMVFVWTRLAGGNISYALVQVAINDISLLALYVPTLYLLLDIGNIPMPYNTVIVSVALFVVFPFTVGAILRYYLLKYHGQASIEKFDRNMSPVTAIALLLTIVLTFIYQGSTIVHNWLHIILLSIPLVLQTYISAGLAYWLCYLLRVPYDVAAAAAIIAGSNFFELAIAIALSVFGLNSGATLVTVVGVLTEVPVMLSLVAIAKRSKIYFDTRNSIAEDEPSSVTFHASTGAYDL